MRSPADADIVQLDICSKCHKSCSHCTRGVGILPEHWEMDPDTFRKAVASVVDWWEPGKVIGLIGGEPTLHSRFEEIVDIFAEMVNPDQQVPACVAPIPMADYNRFAEERLFDRRTGRGLWTAFGPGFAKHQELIYDRLPHWNPNSHEVEGLHQANLIDRKTLCDALGISDEEWIGYRDNCFVQTKWSATVTPWGAYPCEVMAHIDKLFFDGKRAWPIEPGWWKRTPDQFGDMLDLCEFCSLALPGPSLVDADNKDIVSESNRIRLNMVDSPAERRGRLVTYDPAVHTQQRLVTTKDSYTNGARITPDNADVRPKKVAAVVTCVGRSAHLSQTLARNAPLVDELVVVTHPDDAETIGVARAVAELHPHVRLVESARCFEADDAFNKGKLINDGLAALTRPDWVVLTDADCFLPPRFREFTSTYALNPGTLHGVERIDVPPDELPEFLDNGRVKTERLPPPGIDREPNGYFQLFNRRARAIRGRWPAVMAETFCSAGGVDSWLLQQWPAAKRVVLGGLPVVHVAHAAALGEGWNGGTAGGPRWRQWGMLTHDGFVPTAAVGDWDAATPVRLTDTLRGESVETAAGTVWGDCPADLLRRADGDLVFRGRALNGCHVHVAYRG